MEFEYEGSSRGAKEELRELLENLGTEDFKITEKKQKRRRNSMAKRRSKTRSRRTKSGRRRSRSISPQRRKQNNWISNKISALVDEGYPRNQAVAIAISMWNKKNPQSPYRSKSR